MLVAYLEPQDTLGRWMSHHLAELIAAAEAPGASVGQRQEIVATILKIWTHRYYYPGSRPLAGFSSVLAALDRLGNDQTWWFSRLSFDLGSTGPVPAAGGATLVETAADLERLCREVLIVLLWRAAHDAETEAEDWLSVADELASNLESDATSMLRQLSIQMQRRLCTENSAAEDAAADPAWGEDSNSNPGIAEEDPAELDPLNSLDTSKRLRDMASLLSQIADGLESRQA